MSVRARITRDPSRTGAESGVPREPQVRGRPSRHSRAKDKGRATAPGRLRRRPGTGVPRGKGGTCVWPKGGSLTGPSLTPCDPVAGASPPPAGHAPRHCSPRFCPPTGLGRLRQRTAGESGACWGGGGECGPWPWRASGDPPPSWCPAAGMPLKVGSASTCPLDSEVTWAADCPSGQP